VLRRARIANEPVGCLVLEVDSYREIEETFGHALAEELSSLVEERLVDSLRAVGRDADEETRTRRAVWHEWRWRYLCWT